MKIYLKIFVVIMSLLLLVSSFVGCDTSGMEDETKDGYNDWGDDGGDEEDYSPDIEFPAGYENGYEGDDFILYVMKDTSDPEYFVLYDEGSDGSPMQEAVFQRQSRVNKFLNIELISKETPAGTTFSNYPDLAYSAIQNKDGTMDAMITHANCSNGIVVGSGYVSDLSALEGINLSAEYWNQEFMDQISLRGRSFLGFNDFMLLSGYGIGFNKRMLDKYSASIDKSFYDMVRDYEWTLSKMMEIASLVYIDNGDGVKNDKDTYGFSANGWADMTAFLQGCDIKILELTDSGNYEYAIDSSTNYPKAVELINSFKEFAKSNNAYIAYSFKPDGIALYTNRTLMVSAGLGGLTEYLNYDLDFGIVPFPMYDESQANVGYKTLYWGGYLTILSYVQNFNMAAHTVEALAYYSSPVQVVYYEKLLGKQAAESPDDSEMLNLIWDSMCTDVGHIYMDMTKEGGKYAPCFLVPMLSDPNDRFNEGALSSFNSSRRLQVNQLFADFLEDIEKIK